MCVCVFLCYFHFCRGDDCAAAPHRYATLGEISGYDGTDDPTAAAAGLPPVDSVSWHNPLLFNLGPDFQT